MRHDDKARLETLLYSTGGVIALAIILAGLLALPSLPVAQYPNIAPPNVSINANYPGASARTAESAVTAFSKLSDLSFQ